jgi:hypothetical protein
MVGADLDGTFQPIISSSSFHEVHSFDFSYTPEGMDACYLIVPGRRPEI